MLNSGSVYHHSLFGISALAMKWSDQFVPSVLTEIHNSAVDAQQVLNSEDKVKISEILCYMMGGLSLVAGITLFGVQVNKIQ